MLGNKKRTDLVLLGQKKRTLGTMLGNKRRIGASPTLSSSMAEHQTSPAEQKSVLEKMKKTGHNLGQYW